MKTSQPLLVPERLKILQSLMPEVFDEGRIDWEKLRAVLGEQVNFSNERYVLNWAGKSDAFHIMQQPSTATLTPCREESVDFDTTQNIFIEGENMEVLKVLQKSYFGRVKMIYIDPPYNTGNDSFIYPDKFSESKEDYLRRVGDKDDDGYMTREGLFRKNSRENGQYHSNWLSMMMPRLYLAKSLLREDGVIFISIDDNEVHNLRLLMNEIFGEENFVAEFPRITKKAGKTAELVAKNNDYVLCYKRSEETEFYQEKHTDIGYKHSDEYVTERGLYKLSQTLDYGSIQYSPSLDYEINIDGKVYIPGNVSKEEMLNRQRRNPTSDYCWRWSKDLFDFGLKNGFIVVKGQRIYTKTYQNAQIAKNEQGYFVELKERTKSISSIEFVNNQYSNDNARKDIGRIFDDKIFEYSKPISLLKQLIKTCTEGDDLILDFFAGSGTTAHAIMQLNKDGGNRKYICVQLPELCEENSEAYKAGYHTIADISKERIRRAGAKIRAEIEAEQAKQQGQLSFDNEQPATRMPDLGFKVFKLSDSNFKVWRNIKASDTEQWREQTLDFLNPVAPNASIPNMVYEILLRCGKDLNSTILHRNGYYVINPTMANAEAGATKDIAPQDSVTDLAIKSSTIGADLIFMLESATQSVVDAVLAEHPQKVIALDNLFENNDQLKTNTALQFRDANINFKTI